MCGSEERNKARIHFISFAHLCLIRSFSLPPPIKNEEIPEPKAAFYLMVLPLSTVQSSYIIIRVFRDKERMNRGGLTVIPKSSQINHHAFFRSQTAMNKK